MAKAAFNPQFDDPVPTYEESIGSRSTWTPATLHQQLDDTRLTRVRNILSTYVDPLLAVQGTSGIYKTIFLLVPSNVDSLQQQYQARSTEYSAYSQPKEPEVVGFGATDVVKLILLKGEEHTVEFWRQPTVMEELATSLRMRLKMSGHRVEEESIADSSSATSAQVSPVEPAVSAQTNKKSSGWFRSKSKKPEKSKSLWESTAPNEATIADQKLGWRTMHEGTLNSRPLTRGTIRVQVEWREICLRVENAVGLYDTVKGPGISLSVEVGS